MLVLTRKMGEEIVIADGAIVVTVVEIRGDKLRLGITADRSINIDRREIYNEKLAEKIAEKSHK